MRRNLIHLQNNAMPKAAEEKEIISAEKHPQRMTGVVVSAGKMEKTITVKIDRLVWHLKLHKQFSRSKKYLVHDEKGEAKMDDVVVVEKCNPISARKNFRLVKVEKISAKGEKV